MKVILSVLILFLFKFNHILPAKLIGKNRKVIHLDVFESCKSNISIEITDVVLWEDGNRKTLINATYQIHRDISVNTQQFIREFRCKSKDNLDTCEEYINMKLTSFCKFLTAKNQIWSPLFINTYPELKCPLKKGNYSVINGWFDADFLPFSIERNSYWKDFFTVFEEPGHVEVMCLHYEGIVIPVKN